MTIDITKYGVPLKDQTPGPVDISQYGTPIQSEPPQKKKSVFGKVADFARGMSKPFVETGVKIGYQLPKSIYSTINDPLAEPDLSLNVPGYGKVEGPSNDASKEILKSVGQGAEMISYGMGGGAIKEGAKQFGKQGMMQLAKRGAIEGAKIGAVGGAGAQLGQEGELGVDTLKAGAIGAGAGAAFGAALPIVGKGLQKGYGEVNSYMASAAADKVNTANLLQKKIPDVKTATKKLVGGKVVTDKVGKEAVRQGVGADEVALIKAASPTDRSKMLKMLDIREQTLTNKRFGMENRSTDIVGDTFMGQAKHIEGVNKRAAKELDMVAQKLSGKHVDASDAVASFADDLEKAGVTFDKDGNLLFKGSDFEGLKPIQQTINNVWYRAKRVAEKGDALELHRLKRFIDENVSYGKQAQGLSGRSELMLKKFRRSADQTLDNNFSAYNKVNSVYSETINQLNEIADALGSKFKLGAEFANKDAGQKMRRLMSNVQSRTELLGVIKDMQATARKYGMQIDDDILNQAAFADTIEKLLGSEAPTSFLGQSARAGEQAAEILTSHPIHGAMKGAKLVYDLARGVNDKARIEALRKLLSEGGVKSGTNFGKGGSGAVAKSLAKAERSAYTGGMKKTTQKTAPKLVQESKEFVNGKWQKVGFYEDAKGNVTVKPLKQASRVIPEVTKREETKVLKSIQEKGYYASPKAQKYLDESAAALEADRKLEKEVMEFAQSLYDDGMSRKEVMNEVKNEFTNFSHDTIEDMVGGMRRTKAPNLPFAERNPAEEQIIGQRAKAYIKAKGGDFESIRSQLKHSRKESRKPAVPNVEKGPKRIAFEKMQQTSASREEMHNLIDQHMTRKPFDWNDMDELPKAVAEKLPKDLPEYTSKDLGIKGTFDRFNKKTPQFFILNSDEGRFLINTEGYDYSRYASKLPKQEPAYDAYKLIREGQSKYGKDFNLQKGQKMIGEQNKAINKFNNELRNQIDYTRKPIDWDEINSLVPHSNLEDNPLSIAQVETITNEAKKLPRFTMHELGIEGVMDDFKKGVPQHFVLETPKGDVLVNTEGYNYVRYAVKLPKSASSSVSPIEQEAIDYAIDRLSKGDTENVVLNKLEDSYSEISRSDLENIMRHIKSGDLKPSKK